MEQFYNTKLRKIGDSYGVIIPKPIITGLGWKRGDVVVFYVGEGDTLSMRRLDEQTIKQLKQQGALDDEPVINIS